MQQLRMLVVEDDTVNQRVLKHTLALLPFVGDFEIVGRGEDAVAIRQQRPEDFDLILMDIGLGASSITGIEATRQIRDHEKKESLPTLPICALTGDAAKERICLDAGMNAFILKPMDDKKLLAILNELKLTEAH